jgi:hypothetical protein
MSEDDLEAKDIECIIFGGINRCKSSCYSVVAGVVSTYAKESNKDEAG